MPDTVFIENAGGEHEQIWDERISDVIVEFHETGAQAKCNYEFYLGEEFSHSGEMVVDLIPVDASWKITRVWYTVVK